MFALNIDAETGRILSVTSERYATKSYKLVETLPRGDISDYIYINDEFVYSPINYDPCANANIEKGKIFTIDDKTYCAKMPIARGEYITSRNAEPVSVEEYLNALQAQEVI